MTLWSLLLAHAPSFFQRNLLSPVSIGKLRQGLKLLHSVPNIVRINGTETPQDGHHLLQVVQHAQVSLFGCSPDAAVIKSTCAKALFKEFPEIVVR